MPSFLSGRKGGGGVRGLPCAATAAYKIPNATDCRIERLTKQLSKASTRLALDPSLGDIHPASHRPLLMHPLLHRDGSLPA